jgi:hypothetical protein
MGRPPKHSKRPSVQIGAKIHPDIADKLAELREETGDTLSAQVEDGLRRHIRARSRKRQPED